MVQRVKSQGFQLLGSQFRRIKQDRLDLEQEWDSFSVDPRQQPEVAEKV